MNIAAVIDFALSALNFAIMIFNISRGSWMWVTSFIAEGMPEVTHWMPMPEPPEEVQ